MVLGEAIVFVSLKKMVATKQVRIAPVCEMAKNSKELDFAPGQAFL